MASSATEGGRLLPKCIGSSQFYSPPKNDLPRLDSLSSNYLKIGQWSADGTTIIAVDYHNCLKSFILPADFPSADYQQKLGSFSTVPSAEPIYSTAIHPTFSLLDSSTTLVLSSIREHPLRLSNVLSSDTVATYPLKNENTEVFVAPHSIQFNHSGERIITGSNSSISIFDVSRNGAGPLRTFPTSPSRRKKAVEGGVGIKGIVSALHISCEGLLAAGTFNRQIGLYAHEGSGETITVFPVERGKYEGNGITQVLWSPCGRYLYVAERMSDSILVYDIRVFGKRISVLKGRRASTNQRMSMDVVYSMGGYELCAGGADGYTRVWSKPECCEGEQFPILEWRSHQVETVSSVALHPFSPIIATFSGQNYFRLDQYNHHSVSIDQDGSRSGVSEVDNSLKLWIFT